MENCSATTRGGALWAGDWARAFLLNMRLTNNRAQTGAAIAATHNEGVLEVTLLWLSHTCDLRVGAALLLASQTTVLRGVHASTADCAGATEDPLIEGHLAAQAVHCSAGFFTSGTAVGSRPIPVCGPRAQCHMKGAEGSSLQSVICSCNAAAYAPQGAEVRSEGATAPYLLDVGCVTTPRAGSAAIISEGLVVSLSKEVAFYETALRNISLQMRGNDQSASARALWSASLQFVDGSAIRWLTLPKMSGVVPSSGSTNSESWGFSISALIDPRNMISRSEPYRAEVVLDVRAPVDSSYDIQLTVPVMMFVVASVAASKSTWGIEAYGLRCTEVRLDGPLQDMTLSVVTRVFFHACDLDDLPVSAQLAPGRFVVSLHLHQARDQGGAVVPTLHIGQGVHAALVAPPRLGEFTLSLALDNFPVGSDLSFGVTCALQLVPSGETCVCPIGKVERSGRCVECEVPLSSSLGSETCDVW